MAIHTIQVRSKGFQIDVDKMNCDVRRGEHQITWQLPVGGARVEFAEPPVTFFGQEPLPFFRDSETDPRRVTYTDCNQNDTGSVMKYYYQLHLRVDNVPITYPAYVPTPERTGPYISNQPT